MSHDEHIQQQAKAIRWCIVGSLISEYGCMMLSGEKGELKMRVNDVISRSRKLQNYFRFHPQSTPENKEIFEREFLKSEIIAMAELLETVWSMEESGIQEVINAINRTSVEL